MYIYKHTCSRVSVELVGTPPGPSARQQGGGGSSKLPCNETYMVDSDRFMSPAIYTVLITLTCVTAGCVLFRIFKVSKPSLFSLFSPLFSLLFFVLLSSLFSLLSPLLSSSLSSLLPFLFRVPWNRCSKFY